jgi:hypothetical protein
MNFLAAKLGSAFTPEAKQAWTATTQGINIVVRRGFSFNCILLHEVVSNQI